MQENTINEIISNALYMDKSILVKQIKSVIIQV